MHNGVFNTLGQVMDFYNKGKDIAAFMKSLDSQYPLK